MTMPLATCPYCGNDEDGKILIAAFCTVTIEKGDSFLYEDADVTDEARATCLKCGHVSRFRVFKQGVAPPTPAELRELEDFLAKIPSTHQGLNGERLARRCLGLLQLLSSMLTHAPAPAGE